jgi:putative transposase
MKRTRHSAEQIVNKLREADAMLAAGRSIAQVVQQLGVSEPTFHRWRNQYGGMKADDAKRLKELEIENARLKRERGGVRWSARRESAGEEVARGVQPPAAALVARLPAAGGVCGAVRSPVHGEACGEPRAALRRRCSSLRCGHRRRRNCTERQEYHHPTLIAAGTGIGGRSIPHKLPFTVYGRLQPPAEVLNWLSTRGVLFERVGP